MTELETNADLDLDREHELLHLEIERLHDWWVECREYGIPRFGEMGARVLDLRDRLAEHFAWEERGGYLHEVLEPVPRLAARAESLRRQHVTLLAEFDGLVADLRALEPPFESWDVAGDSLDRLLDRLEKHEHAETELVQQAVQEDVGAGD